MQLMLKDSKTKKDSLSTTIIVGTWLLVMVKFMLAGVTIGETSFGTLEPMLAMALLTPIFGYRTFNKFIGARYGSDNLKPTVEKEKEV